MTTASGNTASPGSRVAIVTGAARGIGLAISERLVADGVRVAMLDIDGPTLDAAAAGLGSADVALAVRVDVTNEAEILAGVDRIRDHWGRLDVLVNNAGIAGPAKPSWEYTEAEWRRVLDIDLLSVFLMCRVVVPHLLASGSGRIVNIASISGKEGNPNMSAYSTAKAGVIGFTKALGQGAGDAGRPGQLRHARRHRDRDPDPAHAAGRRVHGQPHPDGSHGPPGGGRGARLVAVVRAVLVHDRRRVRHQWRSSHVLATRRRPTRCRRP